MGEHGAGHRKSGLQPLPLAAAGIAFAQFPGRPVARFGLGQQRLVQMRLAAAGDDIAGALGDHGGGLVVIGLLHKTTARIDRPPQVAGYRRSNFAATRNQCFGVQHLGQVLPPGQRIEGAQQIRHERRTGPGTVVAELAGEAPEEKCARMTDHIGILETEQRVLVCLIGGAVAPALRAGIRRAHQRHLAPRIGAGVRVSRHHRVGHKMPNLDRSFDLAAVGCTAQPVADPDHAVGQAGRRQAGTDQRGAVDCRSAASHGQQDQDSARGNKRIVHADSYLSKGSESSKKQRLDAVRDKDVVVDDPIDRGYEKAPGWALLGVESSLACKTRSDSVAPGNRAA